MTPAVSLLREARWEGNTDDRKGRAFNSNSSKIRDSIDSINGVVNLFGVSTQEAINRVLGALIY